MPLANSNWPLMTPREAYELGFDLTDSLNPNDTIFSITWSIDTSTGSDPNPQSHFLGSPQISGNIVYRLIGQLVPNVTYKISVYGKTVGGELIDVWDFLSCLSS